MARYASATRQGLDEEQIGQLDRPPEEQHFAPRERLAIEFAERMACDHLAIDDGFVAKLREHFSEPEILELGMMIGQYISLGRILVITGAQHAACEIYVPEL